MFVELSKGVALMLSLCLLQGFVYRRWPRDEIPGQVVSGLVFAAVCMVGMAAPIVLAPGVIFDPRSMVLSIAGLFGGPITAGVAAAIVGGYRVWIGGTGTQVGVAVIISCALLGLAYRSANRRGWVTVGPGEFLLFGFLVHLWVIFLFTFLPSHVVEKVLDNIAIPLVASCTVGTAFLGAVLTIVRDQVDTARRLEDSEARFRDLTECSADWYWETDADLRISMLSDRFYATTGLLASDVLGRTCVDLGAEDTDTPKWHRHLEEMAARLPLRGFTFDMQGTDGIRTLSISGKPVFDREGRFQGYRGTATDITEQRRAERARDQALIAAEDANDAKSQFLATMSHELRTPLNAILGFSDILKHQYFGAPGAGRYREYGGYIFSSAQHLLELVDDLLDLSTIEAGATALDKEALDVAAIVSECSQAVVPKALAKDIDLRTEVPADMPPLIADRRSMKQILLNLLANAVKFTPQGGKVAVTAAADAAHIRITVRDTGPGIAPENLDKVTNPFVRGRPSAAQSDAGWGLGLAITKALVDMHGGELTIESRLGEGTVITVAMPVNPPTE